MKRLELRLSHMEDGRIRVFAHSYRSSDSVIPFDRGTRRITVLKALNALKYDSEDFSAEEQKWMVDNGFLTGDKRAFCSDMLVNIGNALYNALFPEGSYTKSALDSLIYSGEELHIQIEVEGNEGNVEQHRLFDYPWELLCHERDFLVEHGINISRYIAYESSPPNLPPLSCINVLLVSPQASDLQNDLKPLSDEESQAVRRGLEQAKSNTKAENTQSETSIHIDEISSPVTFGKLSQYVLEHTGEDTPHIIHFDGHGHFGVLCRNTLPGGGECKTFNPGMSQKCKNEQCAALLTDHQGYLLFEDNSGEPDYVSAKDIASVLGAANRNNTTGHGITLVVLSACKSGFSIAGNSVFNGVAQRLIGQRIPAVVGMAFTVRVDGTIAFMENFYRSVRQKLPLVASMSWGRRMMRLGGNQWYRPVLYMRWQDDEGGQIFAKKSHVPTRYSEGLQTPNQVESGKQVMNTPQVTHQVSDKTDDGPKLDVLPSAITCYNKITFKQKQLLSVFLLFNVLHIEDIPPQDEKLVTQSPLFGVEDIWPEHCELSILALREMIQPTQEFYNLLDKALTREFTTEVIRLRAALMTPLRIIRDLLKDLIPLISKFSDVCQTLSSDMMDQRREIRDKLKSLKENLNKINNPMDL